MIPDESFLPVQRGRRLPDTFLLALWNDYNNGMSIAELGRKYQRSGATIRELLESRGYKLRTLKSFSCKRDDGGKFLAKKRLSATQIAKIINEMRAPMVPREIKVEWRRWNLEKKKRFVDQVRKKLDIQGRPTTPFSSNVRPFDYFSKEARNLLVKGEKRQTKLKVFSQGVIWNGKLWFWNPQSGYMASGWNPLDGRPTLHKVIWETYHKKTLPFGCVLIFEDGNRNNFLPENLRVVTRNDVCRKNQAIGLTKRSRLRTQLLIEAQKGKNTDAQRITSLV